MSLNQSIVKSDNLIIQLRDYLIQNAISLQKLYLGRTLTVIDGCISDPEQRKAIKDLIKDKYWQDEAWTNEIAEILWKFDKKSELHLINDDGLYRTLFGQCAEQMKIDHRKEEPESSFFN